MSEKETPPKRRGRQPGQRPKRKWTTRPSLHLVRTRTTTTSGETHEYAYVRYEKWDEGKGRLQPVSVAALGRTDRLDGQRVDTLGGFLREWLRKDSALPFEALKERFELAEPAMRILCSRDFGLRFLIEQAWRELGYQDALRGLAPEGALAEQFEIAVFAMVLVQLISPQSKRGMANWAGTEVFFPEVAKLDLDVLYESLDVLEAGYAAVEGRLSARLRELGAEPSEFVQDTTTVVCHARYDDEERAAIEEARQARGEAERAAVVNVPPIRMRGHSKAKRNDLPQVVIEAVLGDNGLIVHHETHAGNASDKKMVGPTVEALQSLGYKQVRWANDANFNSADNRAALRAADFEFVSAEGIGRSKVVKEVLAHPGRYSQHPSKPEVSFKCVRALATEEKPARERLYIVRRNTNEEAFQLHTLERHLKRVEEELSKGGARAEALLHHSTYRRYVRRDARSLDDKGRPSGPPILDQDAIAHARHVAGKSVIATDCLEAHPVAEDDAYRQLSDVERVFRELKSSIEIGPIRHRRADRIRAHVMIAIMARNLGAWLARKSGLTLDALRRLFANLRIQEVESGGRRYWERTDLESAQRAIIEKLGYTTPPKRIDPNSSRPSNPTPVAPAGT